MVCLLTLGWLARVDAQTSDTNPPGVLHQGRFIGFVPAHLRATSSRSSAAFNADGSSDTVDQAGFVSSSYEQPEILSEDVFTPNSSDFFVDPDVLEPILDYGFDGHPVDCVASSCTLNLWGRAEYLLWWTSGMDVPKLATTSPDGTPMNQAGVLGQPGTTLLFGNEGLNDQSRLGGRFTLGTWLDSCHCKGLEASYLTLDGETQSFSASNNDFSILARPFLNVQSNAQDARQIAFPAETSGSLDIQASTGFEAFELLYGVTGTNVPGQRVTCLLGYRFAELEDRARIAESTLALAGAIAGTTFDLVDDFNTRNTFHGAQLGIVFAGERNACWSWEALAKLALGTAKSRASVFGETTTTTAGGVATTTQAGLLAQSTNIGTFERTNFSTVSELGVTLRRHFQCGASALFGYSFLYWSDVARAGDQIDLGINPSQIPPGILVGSARPALTFEKTNFWAQGLRFGLEYAY